MPQVIENLPFGDYCQIERMNPSTLVHGRTSMRALKYAMQGRTKEPTQAMQFGNKYHCMILEPEEFEATFLVMPNYANDPENVVVSGPTKGDRSYSWATKFAKEAKQSFETMAELDGKQVITRQEYDDGLYMCESVMAKPSAANIITTCKREVTLLGEIGGVEFKGRLDLCGDGIIADLKGTRSVEVEKFGKDFVSLDYGMKLAIYQELYRQNFASGTPTVKVIAVQTAAPFDCVVYSSLQPSLELGMKQALAIIGKLRQSKATGVWHGVDCGLEELALYVPNWAMPEDEYQLDWEDEKVDA